MHVRVLKVKYICTLSHNRKYVVSGSSTTLNVARNFIYSRPFLRLAAVPSQVPVVPPERASGLRADGVPSAHEDGDLAGQARDQLLPGQRGEEPDPGQAEEEEGEEGRGGGGEGLGLHTTAHRGGDEAGAHEEARPVQEEPPESSGEEQSHPGESAVQRIPAG